MLDFIVIGAQKAGSTYLMQCLRDHPQIYMPWGETPFFEDPDYSEDRLHLLEKVVSPASPGQLRGIKRPNYLGEPVVPARIAKYGQNVKIIAILRDPVSRAISAYFHLLRGGYLPLVPLNQGLQSILVDDWKDKYPLSSTILSYGLYDHHLKRYAQYIDESRLRIVILDDVSREPECVMKGLYDFLGVDNTVVPRRTDKRPMSATYSLPRLRIYRQLRPLVFRKSEGNTRTYPRRGTTFLRKAINGFDHYILSRLFEENKPTVDPGIQQALRDYYKSDVERLRKRLNHPLDGW